MVCHVQKKEDEWLIESEHREGEEDESFFCREEPYEFTKPVRWNCSAKPQWIQALPALPTRPILARPQHAIQIAPHTDLRFFVSIPINLQLYQGQEKPQLLADIPIKPLSDTWFGDPFNGELCYLVRTRAVRHLEEVAKELYRTLTEVTVRNETEEPFLLQRIHVPAAHLSIYATEASQLWTESLRYVYHGDDHPLQISPSHGIPSTPKGLKLLNGAREKLDKNLIHRTFGTLKMFSSWN